jgi:hypothetical protein
MDSALGRGLREAGPWFWGGARCAAWPVVEAPPKKMDDGGGLGGDSSWGAGSGGVVGRVDRQ